MEVDSPANMPAAAEAPQQEAGTTTGAGDATGLADAGTAGQASQPKRKRGRPPGSGTKPKLPPGVHICSTWMDEFGAQSCRFPAALVPPCTTAFQKLTVVHIVLCQRLQ